MNQFEVLASDEPSFNESELFHFQSLVADAKIALQDDYTQLDLSNYPSNVSLLAVSSKFGYYLAGTNRGFVYGSTETLRNTTRELEKGAVGKLQDKIEIIVPTPVQHLRLTADETQAVVDAGAGQILIYNVKDIAEQGAAARPVKTHQLAQRVIDIKPNPEIQPELAAVLFDGGRCEIVDLTTGAIATSIEGDGFTAICWSPKGKQLVCGRKDGKLETYTTSGTLKASIDPPDVMKAGSGDETQNRYILSVHWIDTHVFFTVYARPRESSEDEHIHDAYIVDRRAESTTGIKYTKLEEVTPVFGMDEREAHMYIEVIRDFSTDMKNAIIVAHSAATDISVVGQDENGEWQTWALPENGLAGLPLSEETNMDTFPVGLALDFSTKEDLPPFDEATSSERVKPLPVLMYLNDEDQIGAYYCYNNGIASRGESYAGMIQARDIRDAECTSATPAVKAETSPQQQQQRSSNGPPGMPASNTAVTTAQTPGFSSSPFGAAVGKTANEGTFAALLSGELTAPSLQPTGTSSTSAGSGGFGSFRNLSVNRDAKSPTNNLSIFKGDATPNFGTSSFGTSAFGGAPAPVSMKTGSFADLAKTTQKNKASMGGFEGFGSTASSSAPTFGMSSFGATPEATKSNQSLASLANTASQQKQQQQSLSTGLGAFGTIPSPAAPTTPSTTLGTSSWNSTSGLSSMAFGAKAELKKVEPSATSTAAKPSLGETGATEVVLDESPTKTELVEDGVPQNTKNAAEAVSSTEKPSSSDGPSTTATAASTTNAGSGDLSKSFDSVKISKEAPAKSAITPTAASGFGSFGQPSSTGGSFSFANLSKVSQSLPKATGFGSGQNLFGSGSAPTPSFGIPSFGSTTSPISSTSVGPKDSSPAAALLKEPTAERGAASPLAKADMLPLATDKAIGEQDKKPVDENAPPLFSQPATSKVVPATLSHSEATTSVNSGTTSSLPKITPAAAAPTPISPLKSKTTTSAPVPKPEATVSTTPKPKPVREPSAEETMATEFESLYIMVNDSFKKLAEKQSNLKSTADAYRKETPIAKSLYDLDHENSWRVGDAQDLSAIADELTARAQGLRPKIGQIQQSLDYFDEDTMKLRAKDATIAELLKSEPGAKIKQELGDRELNKEALMKWKELKSRSEFYGEELNVLEDKIQDYKKKLRAPVRSKSSSNEGFYSLYGLYVLLREIDKELKAKETTVKGLEDQFAYAHFKAIHDQARRSALGIGIEDEDNDKDEDEGEGQDIADDTSESERGIRTEGPWPDPLVESTVRNLRREQFLDKVWQFQSQKAS